MNSQRGIAHLLLLIVLAAVVLLIFFIWKGSLKVPGISQNLTKESTAAVAVKTEYKNPFKKENQYINPFDEYKSPFINLNQSE